MTRNASVGFIFSAIWLSSFDVTSAISILYKLHFIPGKILAYIYNK